MYITDSIYFTQTCSQHQTNRTVYSFSFTIIKAKKHEQATNKTDLWLSPFQDTGWKDILIIIT